MFIHRLLLNLSEACLTLNIFYLIFSIWSLLVKMFEKICKIKVLQSRMRFRGSFWIGGEERVRD